MLTPKQEKFVQGIVQGMSHADAYRSAYSCKKMSDNAIYREASLMVDSPKIAQRLPKGCTKHIGINHAEPKHNNQTIE